MQGNRRWGPNKYYVRVYDEAGNVIETHEHKGEFKEPWVSLASGYG